MWNQVGELIQEYAPKFLKDGGQAFRIEGIIKLIPIALLFALMFLL